MLVLGSTDSHLKISLLFLSAKSPIDGISNNFISVIVPLQMINTRPNLHPFQQRTIFENDLRIITMFDVFLECNNQHTTFTHLPVFMQDKYCASHITN